MKIQYRNGGFSDLITHTAWGISLHHWLRLLWQNKFKIHWRSIPKAFLITWNAIICSPIQCYEYFYFRKHINKVKIDRPIFIIGHHRSGTTHLHYLLSKDPRFTFCSTYEAMSPYTFLSVGRIFKKVLEWSMPSTRPQDNVKAGADLPIEEEFAMGNMSSASLVNGYYFPQSIYKVFDENVLFKNKDDAILNHWKGQFLFLVKKLLYKKGEKKIVLKSPANTARIKELLDLFPDARFIHIYRNPYDVYLSMVNLYEKILPTLGFQRVENDFMNEFVLYAYENLYHKFLKEKPLIPREQLVEFSYEDFVASPLNCLKKTYHQLDLGSFEKVEKIFEAELEASKKYKTNAYDAVPEDVRARITTQWKFAFDAFGYRL